MAFLAGVVGIARDDDGLALRPAIGWAVREAGQPHMAELAARVGDALRLDGGVSASRVEACAGHGLRGRRSSAGQSCCLTT